MPAFATWFSAIVIVTAALIAWIVWTQLIGAAFTPTPKNVVERMLQFADLKEGDVLYDLGSGDGRVVIQAAKKYGVRSVGIDADPLRVAWSRLMVRWKGVGDRVSIIQGNIFNQDIGEATVVTIFLTQWANRRLKPTLLRMKEGTRVVTHIWTFEGWEPFLSDEKLKVYAYQVPR